MQANVSNNLKKRVLISEVYELYEIKLFYKGGKANFSRALLKETFRNPMRGFIKSFFTENLPKSIQLKYPEIRNVATGVSMAAFDTFKSIKICHFNPF